ncbi:hypothetical protein RQCS_61550 (plasmid) [Rhodococcus qingshengii]|nr:hypothetical protein RQCS_61550 [Rhodococcus qingshengii]
MAFHFDRLAVVANDGQPFGIDRANNRYFSSLCNTSRHPYGMSCSGTPTANGQSDQIKFEQLAKLAAELEPGLIAAVI